MIRSVEAIMLEKDLARKRDVIVITAGVPTGVAGSTNMMKLHRVGELKGLEADRPRGNDHRRYRVEKGLP
jgi:pyruvate kinase